MPKMMIRYDEPIWEDVVSEHGDPRAPVTFATTRGDDDVTLTAPTAPPSFDVDAAAFVDAELLGELPWPDVDADASDSSDDKDEDV